MIELPKNWTLANIPPKQGGQGIVYFVQNKNENDNRLYALKMLKDTDRLKNKVRFINEIKAIQKIGFHDNIIKIHENIDINNHSGIFYYVMEIADKSLQDFISDKNLCIEECARIFNGICNGVKYIHNKRIIHRDLKPQNILFINNVPKVADFGICLFLDQTKRCTHIKERVGPINYMAPELEDGLNLDVDFRADIYSLGKILYFILSGGRIFSREKYDLTDFKLINIKSDERYEVFDEFFSKTITYQVEKRYQSIEYLINGFSCAFDKFQNKPYSLLIKKEPNYRTLVERSKLSFIDNLDDNELGALLQYLFNNNNQLPGCFFEKIKYRINESNVVLCQKLICRNQDNINFETLKSILIYIYSNKDLYSVRDGMNEFLIDSEFRKMLKLIAIDIGDSKVINNIASDFASKLMINFEAVKEIFLKLIKNFNTLERKFRIRILSEMSRKNLQFVDKDEFYINQFSYIMNNDFIFLGQSESAIEKEEQKLILEELGYVIGSMSNLPSLDNLNRIVNVLNVLGHDEFISFISGVYNNIELVGYLKDNLKDKAVVISLEYLLRAREKVR